MADTSPRIRFDNVTVQLGGRVVIDGFSFECAAGEWVVIVGPSGCGKTTLLRTINGLETPTAGTAVILDSAMPGRSPRQARQVWRRTGTVMQDIALFDTRNVRANVALGLKAAGQPRRAALAEASVWLERLGLADKQHERPVRLSGGQRQRVALARAFAPRPRLLVLDEPTSALDRATARTVLDAIKELASTGTAVVMSSHRVDEVDKLCDRVVDLDGPHTPPASQYVPEPELKPIPAPRPI